MIENQPRVVRSRDTEVNCTSAKEMHRLNGRRVTIIQPLQADNVSVPEHFTAVLNSTTPGANTLCIANGSRSGNLYSYIFRTTSLSVINH